MHTKEPVRLGMGQDLHLPVCRGERLGATVRHEGETALAIGDPRRLEFFLRAADACDLRGRVDHIRNRVVVHVTVARDQALDAGHALFFGFVREHRPGDDVPNREDAGHDGLKVPIDGNPAPGIGRDADGLEGEPIGIGSSAHGDQDTIGGQGRAAVAGDEDLIALDPRPGDPRPELEDEALLLEDLAGQQRDLRVHAGQDTVQELEDGDLRTESEPDGPELEANGPGPDDDEMLRHRRVRERLRARADPVAVEVQPRQRGDSATRREEDALCRQFDRSPAVDLHAPRVKQPPRACVADNAVLFEETGDTVGQLANDAVLALQHRAQIELDLADADAMRGEPVFCLVEALAGLQQGLAGDASDSQARAAEGGLSFDAGDLQPELGSADRGDITAGAGADDDQIIRVGLHPVRPPTTCGPVARRMPSRVSGSRPPRGRPRPGGRRSARRTSSGE